MVKTRKLKCYRLSVQILPMVVRWGDHHYNFLLKAAVSENMKDLVAQHSRHVTREGEGGLPCSFLKTGKKCPNLEKKCPYCGHLWVKFLI